MISKKVKYTDFAGNVREEEFFFNLSQQELVKMEIVHNGKFREHLEEIVASQDGKRIITIFEDILHDSYGKLTLDGKSFIKTEEDWQIFKGTEAYSQLFLEIVTEAGQAAAFINGLVPADLAARVAEQAAQPGFRPGADTSRPTPPVAGLSTNPDPNETVAQYTERRSVEEETQLPPVEQPTLPSPPVQVSPEPAPWNDQANLDSDQGPGYLRAPTQ